MREALIALMIVTVEVAPARAEEAPPSAVTVSPPMGLRRFTLREPSGDRDEPALSFGSLGGRLHAMGGATVVLLGVHSPALRFGLTVGGFVELVNFGGGGIMPWQTFRGHLGLGTVWESPWIDRRLPRGGGLFLEAGFFHESDHAVDAATFVATHVDAAHRATFNNGSMSSYEFVKLRLGYRQALLGDRLILSSVIGTRLFTPPVAELSERKLVASVILDERLTVRLHRPLHAFASLFFEWIDNGFVAARCGCLSTMDRTPLRYLYVDLGLEVRSPTGVVLMLAGTYSYSHGRSIDFFVDYGHEWGVSGRMIF